MSCLSSLESPPSSKRFETQIARSAAAMVTTRKAKAAPSAVAARTMWRQVILSARSAAVLTMSPPAPLDHR
jgi:hypothetical protein